MDADVKRVLFDLTCVIVGLFAFATVQLYGFVLGFSLFLFGIGLQVVGLFDFICYMNGLNKQQRLLANNSGLAWVWIVGFGLTIPMCALIYWCLDYPFDLIVQSIGGMYTFTGVMAYAWSTTQFIISYLLAFVIIYAVIWVIVNSKTPNFWS